MKYFSAFSLQDEASLFDNYISKSDTTVIGFSYGAQKAFDYVYGAKYKIDKLILLSPAFFQTQKKSFIRTQLRYYDTAKSNYIKQFILNTKYPSKIDLTPYLAAGTKSELDSLLHYQWNTDKIKEVLNKGISIEVFLGTEDKIIDFNEAHQFFSMTKTYIIKDVGHILKGKE